MHVSPPATETNSEPEPKLRGSRASGAAVLIAGTLLAYLAHHLLNAVGTLTWAMLLGAVVANLGLVPSRCMTGHGPLTKRLLRAGIVLLGLSLSLEAIADLGWALFVLVSSCLVATLLLTYWVARVMGLTQPRALLLAAGFSVCGASAVAAMEEPARANEDDVAVAIALVTLFGTVMMVALPLLQRPLGLDAVELGTWAGASVHEVGQVVGAAGPAGLAAVAVAVVVKLTRVLMLAPIVIAVQLIMRRVSPDGEAGRTRQPLVPLFILGFLGCVVLRTFDVVPAGALSIFATAQTATLSAAMFGLGLGVTLRGTLSSSGSAIVVAAVSTAFIASTSLVGVMLLG